MNPYKVGDIVATHALVAQTPIQGVVLTADARGCVLAAASVVHVGRMTQVYRYVEELEPVVL